MRFDGTRGYGFIAPEGGGEDVFLHVNDLLIPESYLRAGLEVEFEVEDGGRGLKASSVRLAHGAETPPEPPAPDVRCDVPRREEYAREVTELLLKAGPGLTGEQILELRHELVKAAEAHGWIRD